MEANRMKFIGRKKELEILEDVYSTNKMECVLVYGRRRIGKTELIKKSIQSLDCPCIYYEAKQSSEMSNVNSLSELISHILGFPKLGFESFEEILDFLFTHAKDKRMVFVLDEYPYLRTCIKGLDSIIQTIVDKHLHSSKLKFILCGSYVDTMKSLTERENPLYGRFSRTIDLKPMDYYESGQFYNAYSMEDKIALYSVFGGIPYYNQLIDSNKSVQENIIHLVASSNAILNNEVFLYLKNEITKINNANDVFEALAMGNTKFTDILNKSHISSSPLLSDVLDKLIKMEIVAKKSPINDKTNKKKSGYYICDNFILFFYKYIYRYSSQLNVMNEKSFFEYFIQEDFYKSHIPHVFENICQQYLIRQNKQNKLSVPFFEIGKYYYDDPIHKKNGEFDIVTLDPNGYIFYECKYRKEKVTDKMIHQEIDQVKQTGLNCYKYGFFSKSGFDVQNKDNLILYNLEQLYQMDE